MTDCCACCWSFLDLLEGSVLKLVLTMTNVCQQTFK